MTTKTTLISSGNGHKGRGSKPPYASTAAMEQFLERVRNRNAPSKVDQNLLLDFSIAPGATAALLSALRWLGLIDVAGAPSETFKGLQTPLDDELAKNIREILEVTYAEALSRLDITKDGRDHIKAYFARNHSVALAEKMSTFFLYLSVKAGMEPAGAAKRVRKRGVPKTVRAEGVSRRPQAARGVIAQPRPIVAPRVSSVAEFWRTHIGNLEAIQVSLEQTGVAAEIIRLKNDLIQEALNRLAEQEAASD